jgi:acetyl-CoA C-acetyltransferase
MSEAYIVAALRTPGGKKGGCLKDWHPADLGGFVIDALLARTGIDPAVIEDTVFGCVTQAGEQASNIGRQSVLASSLPHTIPGTTVDRACGSSQQALHFASQAVKSGAMDVVLVGGVESMTRAPMGLAAHFPSQHGFGHYQGPRCQVRYPGVKFSQFDGAERMVSMYELSKPEFDEFALESHRRAAHATANRQFIKEIVPVPVRDRETGEESLHDRDEGIRYDAALEAIAGVKPISENGVLSAAHASQICDGAAALLVVNEAGLKKTGLSPLARVHHMSVLGGDPVVMLDVPIAATQAALQKTGMSIQDIDLYEVNEAFAPIPLAWAKKLGADMSKMNVNGGALALGHPLGASGCKLMTTLIHALHAKNGRFGLQTMCEGGGMANVTIVERL